MWNESSSNLGGGFLDDSTQAGGKKSSQSNDKSIIPIWIKHVTSTTGDLQIAGRTVNTMTFIGIVRRIEQDTTKMSFSIQDDTGTLTAVMWLEADKNPAENTCVQLNTYVRVHGLIRNQNNQRHVLILRMYPVENLNEVTSHFLEVMCFILTASQSEKESEKESVSDIFTFDNTMSGMSSDQMKILQIVRSANDSECGIEKREILAKMPTSIQRIDEILDFLLCEGHIYTTSSEDFFKAT